jgi:general nucleoside transport system ATP-binding protein
VSHTTTTATSAGTATAAPALELVDIVKSYGPVRANQDVSLVLRAGSVHAVLGENGAGKSTLMKILFGVEKPDSGTIRIGGVDRVFKSPRDAIGAGIGMVFQHFGLVEELTALDNIALGAEVSNALGVKRTVARRRIEQIAGEVGLEVPLGRRVRDLTISQQQRVEILKALYRGARILILDEPTALLAPQERLGLFAAVKRLQSTGVSVLFITHKLDEADYLADDVTVMRLGRVVARHRIGEVNRDQLINDMVGETTVAVERPDRTPEDVVLELVDVSAGADATHPLRSASVQIRRGEVLGVVGIDGHGHQLLCQVLAGVRPITGGSITLRGTRQRRWNRAIAMRKRVSYVPEDRLLAGVARDQSIAENLVANRLSDPSFVRAGFLRRDAIARNADEMIRTFDIRCRDREQAAARLSGGNVQKVVLAREISVDPDLLVVCEPTRGLDIGAIANVHSHLSATANRGASVVVQSSDLDEILAVADRILIFRDGAPVADIHNDPDIDVAALGAIMLGTSEKQP